MSVLGSQLEIDLDPDGDMTVVPRHVGNTGTGCYKLHDHAIRDTKKMPNIPVSEKVEATYMYAPTPEPEPEPEPEEEEDDEDDPDAASNEDKENKNGKGPPPGGESSGGTPKAANNDNSSNNSTKAKEHLLDAPLKASTSGLDSPNMDRGGSNKPRPRFELDNDSASASASNAAAAALANKDCDNEMIMGGKRRPSYMPTRGLAAVLNQGLATLGEKLATKQGSGNLSSTEALDMNVRKVSDVSLVNVANGGSKSGSKKSILKKSESSAISSNAHKPKTDPELENLLVSDTESANTTPAAARKQPQPISIADLPPTANHEQLKSLTGPKLRVKEPPMPRPILVKNNGNVASKEIQTSTISLLALANAAAASNNNGNNEATSVNFKCPNDTCRHNKVSSAMNSSSSNKRKICLCGRTMVNVSLLHRSSEAAGASGGGGESMTTTSKQHS